MAEESKSETKNSNTIENDTNETKQNDEENDWMNEFVFKDPYQLLGHKVIKNYNKHILNNKQDLIPYILVAGGTFSPVHRMHVVNMELAKQHIEKKDNKYRVVGGFISPTHDSYCKYKLGDLYIPAVDRIKMLSLALEDNNWIEVSPWHPNQEYQVSIHEEVSYIETMIQRLYPKQYDKFTIFYVCGSDLASKCSLNYGFDEYGVCIIQRESDLISPSYINLAADPPVYLVDIPNKYNDIKNASSTELRYCIYHGQKINHLTFDSVQQYMVENDILGASRLKQVLEMEKLTLKTNVSDKVSPPLSPQKSVDKEEMKYNKSNIYFMKSAEEEAKIKGLWDVNDFCFIHSTSKKQWFKGEIIKISGSTKDEWLTVRYGKIRKEIQRCSGSVRAIPPMHPENFRKGSKCKIFSRQTNAWCNGKIEDIVYDTEGEWLRVRYFDNNEMKSCDIQRYSPELKVVL